MASPIQSVVASLHVETPYEHRRTPSHVFVLHAMSVLCSLRTIRAILTYVVMPEARRVVMCTTCLFATRGETGMRSRWYFGVIVKTVWVVGVYLTPTIAMAHGEQTQGTYVTTTTVDVKQGPRANSTTIRRFAKGTTVAIMDKERPWLKVRLSEHENRHGYIDARLAVIKTQPEVIQLRSPIPGVYRTTTMVNLRQGPGENYAIISKIPKDTTIVVIGMEGNWLRIASKHGAPPRYIERSYARLHLAD